jgi:hypothetical protein
MSDQESDISKRHVGKFVCYQRADGGACWGRVKDQGFVNTMKGEREVLILDQRYVRYERNKNVKQFRQFYPDAENDPSLRRPMQVNKDGQLEGLGMAKAPSDYLSVDEELFFEVRYKPGDSTLRLESIDEERDLIEPDELFDVVDRETLFEALLAGKKTLAEALKENRHDEIVPSSNREVSKKRGKHEGATTDIRDGGSGAFGNTAIEIGLRHLIREGGGFDGKVKAVLEERFGEKFDNTDKDEDNEEDD